jgi:hypothetical protein
VGAAGVLAVSTGVVTDAAGAAPTKAGVAAIAAGKVTGAASVEATAAGVLIVSDDVPAVAAAPEGVMTAVSEDGVRVAAGAAVAATQCSEIMFSSVTAMLLSTAVELTPLALCPMRVTSWPRCGFRSTLLVVSLKMWPVLSSATV